MARTLRDNLRPINILAGSMLDHGDATSWGDAFRAAVKLLRRKSWAQHRPVAAAHLRAMARQYLLQGDVGRSKAFHHGASVVETSPSYAAATRRSGIGPSLRREIAATALPYGSVRWSGMFGRREVRESDLKAPVWGGQ